MVRASFDFDVISDPAPRRRPLPDQGAGATTDTHGLVAPTAAEATRESQTPTESPS
jgi:hypothetical protein